MKMVEKIERKGHGISLFGAAFVNQRLNTYFLYYIENATEKQCTLGNDVRLLDNMLDSLVVMKAEGTVGSAAEANLEIWKLSARPGLTCTDPDYFKI